MSAKKTTRRSKYEPTPEAVDAEYTAGAGAWYNPDGLDAYATAYCGRCGGSGYLTGYEHVEGGVCFGCRGRGKWRMGITNREKCRNVLIKRAKADAAAARAAAKQQIHRRGIRAELRKLPADLRAALVALRRDDSEFVRSVRGKVVEYGYASEAQHAAIVAAAARLAARATEVSIPAPVGRVLVAGKVLKSEQRESMYGDQFKMLVLVETPDGNYRVWSTVPNGSLLNAHLDGYLRGRVVEFTATLKQSDRDPAFAFASRPAKARLV